MADSYAGQLMGPMPVGFSKLCLVLSSAGRAKAKRGGYFDTARHYSGAHMGSRTVTACHIFSNFLDTLWRKKWAEERQDRMPIYKLVYR
jgi:hypothetical protein